MSAIEELRGKSAELTSLANIMALLQWDQEVMMPSGATADRANQSAVLSAIIHRQISSPAMGELLDRTAANAVALSIADQALLRVMRREYDQSTRVPAEFVAEFSRLSSQALAVWVKARRQSDFSSFLPLLDRIVAMCRQKAGYLAYANEPYDALLDLYEEGLQSSDVDRIFKELQTGLVDLLGGLQQQAVAAQELFSAPFNLHEQIEFSGKVLEKIGYDLQRGRLDRSPHPFSTSLGHHDRRLTNRYHPRSMEFIFSALHEGGHGLYEQGVASDLAGSHLDCGVSLGIHESQSRLWENIIGRSRPFWENFYPELKRSFPAQFNHLDLDGFVAMVNTVKPGLIRVEADELTYNLHILIRFELERALLAGSIQAVDLPALWHEKYRDYLGVEVKDDADGVLQDIHWAHGSFGYFPTYTIGNLAAAQIWQAYCLYDPDHRLTVATGDLARIKNWLTENIYCHGAIYPPAVLMEKVTGERLSSRFFIEYLRHKYQEGK